MGTHPIFESDFDCLTDGSMDIFTVQDTRLYDGDVKTNYKNGTTIITSHAIKFELNQTVIEIPLRLVILCSSLPGSWTEKERLEISLQSWEVGWYHIFAAQYNN